MLVDDPRIFWVPIEASAFLGNREVDLRCAKWFENSSGRCIYAHLCEDNELVARQVEFLDSIPEDDLGLTVRVNL